MMETTSGGVAGTARPVLGPVSPYLTAAEAAEYLRTTVQGVYALVKRGRIKPMPGSRKLLFTKDALDARMKSRSCRH